MELEILYEIVAGVMKVDTKELKPETTFMNDLGADSLDICRILMEIEDRFGVTIPRESIYSVSDINDALNLIKNIKKL